MNLDVSRRAAVFGGVFVILVETWRRSHQILNVAAWPSLFDDWIAGALLIAASLITRRDAREGRVWLAGAWGYAAGMMYMSFFGQLAHSNQPDASGVSPVIVLSIKGAMLLGCVLALIGALRRPSHS